jgi:hypothetical protein
MNNGHDTKEKPMNSPSQTPKKRGWKLILLGVVIFFCGMVIGAGITFHAGHLMMFRAMNPQGRLAERITKHIDRDLHLTGEQKDQVGKIVADRVSAFRTILMESYGKITEQFALLNDQVVPILTEEQKAKWEEHHRKMQNVITRIQKRLPPDRK